jgi:pimeloyl-ACP methyl ester carboxylesterase
MSARLIFLHGGPGYLEYLKPFFAREFPKEFETVFYSQKRLLPVSVDDLIEELDEKVLKKNVPTFLIGHSWGGPLAVEYWRQKAHHHIKGIVLINSFLCADDVTVEYEKEKQARGLRMPSTAEIFLTPAEIGPSGNLIHQLDLSFDKNVFESLWNSFVKTFDARPFVKNSRLPILNVIGEKDVRIPARCTRLYGKLSPHVKNVEIKGSAHFPFILPEHRQTTVSEILKFVRTHSL